MQRSVIYLRRFVQNQNIWSLCPRMLKYLAFLYWFIVNRNASHLSFVRIDLLYSPILSYTFFRMLNYSASQGFCLDSCCIRGGPRSSDWVFDQVCLFPINNQILLILKQLGMGNAQTQPKTNSKEASELITKAHLGVSPQPQAAHLSWQRGQSSQLPLDATVLHSDRLPVSQPTRSIYLPKLSEDFPAPPLPLQQKLPLDQSFFESLKLPEYVYPENGDVEQASYGQFEDQYRKYMGQTARGVPNGKGVMLTRQEMYIGWFKNGEKHFHGREVMTDEVYQGEFYLGKRKGKGVRYKASKGDQDRFLLDKKETGQFNLGLIHGKIQYKDGSLYEGQLVNGLRKCENAYFYWPDGVQYRGNFHNDIIHGKGTLIWLDKSRRYEGNFVKQKKHGKGRFTWNLPGQDQMIYEGDYVDGVKQGEGKLIISSKKGHYYEGQFYKDKPHGKGKLKDHKLLRQVQFYNGKLINQSI